MDKLTNDTVQRTARFCGVSERMLRGFITKDWLSRVQNEARGRSRGYIDVISQRLYREGIKR